jgi:hypothetical protein
MTGGSIIMLASRIILWLATLMVFAATEVGYLATVDVKDPLTGGPHLNKELPPAQASPLRIRLASAIGGRSSIRYLSGPGISDVLIADIVPYSGRAGNEVTIYGAGFSTSNGLNTVYFKDAMAKVLSASPTKIVTVVPKEATTGPISVTTESGTATSSNPFIVIY